MQLLALALLGLSLAACEQGSYQQSEQSDRADTQADAHGIQGGSSEALAILHVANTMTEAELDGPIGLDRRAARAIIVARRGLDGIEDTTDDIRIPDLPALDSISFVSGNAFGSLLSFAEDEGVTARFLRIASLNIRWFGLNGSFFGSFGSEARNESIRSFITERLATVDVLVLQEIVDVDLFLDEVVFDLDCVTYDRIGGKHQHIVLCHNERVFFRLEQDDDNFGLESLRMSNLRAGLHGVLVDAANDIPIAHIIGVHLKARADSTTVRLEQAEILRARLAALDSLQDNTPKVLIGDFNTHDASATGGTDDDDIRIDEVLNSGPLAMEQVDLQVDFTFRKKNGVGFKLDRAWHSSDFEVVATEVEGPCNLDMQTGEAEIAQHFNEVSDHCAIVVTFFRE